MTGLVVVMVIAAAVWFLVLPRLRPHVFSGTVIQSNTPAPAIELTSSRGGPVSLADFEDQVVVLYFGYTYCPDVCPTTLAKLDDALDELGPAAEDVQVVMVTVDPQRDDPDHLSRYLGAFNDDFIGLTGNLDEIASVATVYGVYFQVRDDLETAAEYLVDHTASLMVVDKAGYLKLVLPPDASVEDIASDLGYLV